MKKAGFLLGLLLLLGLTVQCTEDDDMDTHVAKTKQFQSDSGEEGSDNSDNEKD